MGDGRRRTVDSVNKVTPRKQSVCCGPFVVTRFGQMGEESSENLVRNLVQLRFWCGGGGFHGKMRRPLPLHCRERIFLVGNRGVNVVGDRLGESFVQRD